MVVFWDTCGVSSFSDFTKLLRYFNFLFLYYEGQSISFQIDDVKHRKLTLDIRGRHHLHSSPLLRLDNNPSGAATF